MKEMQLLKNLQAIFFFFFNVAKKKCNAKVCSCVRLVDKTGWHVFYGGQGFYY